MHRPGMFSMAIPNLQVVWDATSLKLLMECPRKYQRSILEGWSLVGDDDLDFGRYFASATETYKKARLAGHSKREASIIATRYAIEATWVAGDETTPGQPWSGRYDEQWHCEGTEPYRNGRGNRAKCPWSHKGHWFPGPAPSICGTCGSGIHSERRWVSDNPAKDRYALVRLVMGWCDEQAEDAESGVMVYAFPDGTPAVELSFKMPLPWRTPAGEAYILSGHFDGIDKLADETFISDNKTTKMHLGPGYFSQFWPNVQVETYDLAGATLFQSLGIRGVRIDAAQTLKGGGMNFGSQVFRGTDAQRGEYLRDLEYWLQQAETFAQNNYWPKNRAACWRCPFKEPCGKDPEVAERMLRANYSQRWWNPAEER